MAETKSRRKGSRETAEDVELKQGDALNRIAQVRRWIDEVAERREYVEVPDS